MTRGGGDRYAGKRLVVAALIESIKVGRSDKYFRDEAGIKAGREISNRVRESVARREAERIYKIICGVFLNGVVGSGKRGGSIRLDGFGKIALVRREREEEVRWLDNYGVHCYDPDTGLGLPIGERRMYKAESTQEGLYAIVSAHFYDDEDRRAFVAGMVAVGWVDNGGYDVFYGPINKKTHPQTEYGSYIFPWIGGLTSPVPVHFERRIKEFGPGARRNMIWACDDDEFGEACKVSVVYKSLDSKWRLSVTK